MRQQVKSSYTIQQLLDDFERLNRDQPGNKFNLFTVLNLETDEVTHSAFLAFLLDWKGGHGQGDRFLRAFLTASRPPIMLDLPEAYQVRTEFPGTYSIIDILVYAPHNFLLCIENKVTSADTAGQHNREFRDMRQLGERLSVPLERQFSIYLTPRGRRAKGKHRRAWYQVAYCDLGKAIEAQLTQTNSQKAQYVIGDIILEYLSGTGVDSPVDL